MNKFMDVDLIESLGAIMRQNTGFYQSDFEIDKEILREATSEPKDMDRTFVWLSRPCGTNCFREYKVFMKDSPSYNAWQFYGKMNYKRALAYVVEIIHNEGNVIKGNLYELDFQQHCEHVAAKALPIDQTKNGSIQHILWEEKQDRDRLKEGNFKKHLESLRFERIETEGKGIVEKIKELEKPNSPDGEYFMTALSPAFIALASNEDINSLFSMMPYKRYAFSKKKESIDIYVCVAKEENRNKNIRKMRMERRIENEDHQSIEFKGRSSKEFFGIEYCV